MPVFFLGLDGASEVGVRSHGESIDTRVRELGEKLGFPHPILAIRFSKCFFLAIDFNDVGFLCTIFWVHSGWRLSVGDDLLGGPSIIKEFHYSRDACSVFSVRG